MTQNIGATERLPDSPPVEAPPDSSVMTLVEHLSELRRRVVICVIAIVIGGVVGWLQAPNVISLLVAPLPTGKVQFITLGGGFLLYFKVALVFGVVIGLPVILYELWAFVSPGLTPRERREVLPLIPMSVVFFTLGLIVAYVTLPFAVAFLAGFQIPGKAELFPTGEAYFGFVTVLFLVFGAVMEFPIALVLLSKLGIIKAEKLRASRRMVLLGITIFAVVVTPGGDPVSPTVMTITMYILYEFTIFYLSRRKPVDEPPIPASGPSADA